MVKKSRNKRRRRPPSPEGIHLTLGPEADHDAAVEAIKIDAVADRQWLQDHPEEKDRRRLPSIREIIAFDLPPGISVVVMRGPAGSQMRVFLGPKK